MLWVPRNRSSAPRALPLEVVSLFDAKNHGVLAQFAATMISLKRAALHMNLMPSQPEPFA